MRAVRHAVIVATAVFAGWLVVADGGHGAPRAEAENAVPAGTPATVLTKDKAQAILGKPVTSTKGEAMGRIVDVIVDKAGTTRAAIIDFGGFLGVGSRQIAVDWAALHFSPAGQPERITLDLTRDQLKSAPQYEKGKPVVVLGASGNTQPLAEGEYPLDH
ncbi:MAG: PRC-barrel domain-containing protein [Alphaproteobacteria bacterium]|nr:PRC-barrel domain-containing protein [Alphaproteobacteria bacterium]